MARPHCARNDQSLAAKRCGTWQLTHAAPGLHEDGSTAWHFTHCCCVACAVRKLCTPWQVVQLGDLAAALASTSVACFVVKYCFFSAAWQVPQSAGTSSGAATRSGDAAPVEVRCITLCPWQASQLIPFAKCGCV